MYPASPIFFPINKERTVFYLLTDYRYLPTDIRQLICLKYKYRAKNKNRVLSGDRRQETGIPYPGLCTHKPECLPPFQGNV